MDGQKMADEGSGDGEGSGMGMNGGMGQMSTGTAGMSANAGGSGGGMPSGNRDGNGDASGMMTAAAGGGAAGTAGSPPTGTAGTGTNMPPVRVVAACMGRGGETVCDNATLIKCGMAGDAEMMMSCKTAAQCKAGMAAGMCGMCDPGTVECMGTELRECGMNGEFTLLDTCATEALCDKAAKQCEPPACEVDQHSCESGYLMKCAEDRTEFEMVEPCEMELCDAENKKCNVCVPSSKVCMNDQTLTTCSADGLESTEMDCGETMKCAEDRCVQCTTDAECTAPNDCQTVTCNVETGMCNAPVAKTVGTTCSSPDGGKVCDLIGNCVACVTDLDCGAATGAERCSPVFGCVPRAPLTVSAISVLGAYSVTLAPGYSLTIDNNSGADVRCGSLIFGLATTIPSSSVVTTFTCSVGDSSTCTLDLSFSDRVAILRHDPDMDGVCEPAATLTAEED